MANSNQYDIVFIIDESGSMGSYINNVKNNISSFVGQLESEGIDVQLGLVKFEGKSAIKKYELTKDVGAFISNLSSIRPYGADEYGLTAITDPTNGALSLNFRENTNKEFIVVTDEGYEENNSYNIRSATDAETVKNDTIQKLQANQVKLDVFGEMDSGYYNSCQDEWTPIANATTGRYINGTEANGKFYDIREDFSRLLMGAVTGDKDHAASKVLDGTHQLVFAQWSYGFTPSTENNSATDTPIIAPGA